MKRGNSPQIVLERQGANTNEVIKIAHMCSNCHVHNVDLETLLKSVERGIDEWKVEIIDDRTVQLRAPEGVTFVKDIQIPVEEIMLAIIETKALRQRTKK